MLISSPSLLTGDTNTQNVANDGAAGVFMHVEQLAANLKWVCMVTVVLCFLSWFDRKDTENRYKQRTKSSCIKMSVILNNEVYIPTPASFQDNPDVLKDDGVTELKLQTKRYLNKGEKIKFKEEVSH